MKRFRSLFALLVLFGALAACSEMPTAPQAQEECTPTIGGGGRCAE